jgi:hypothetical protein
VVELLPAPARAPSQAPIVRTLSYPVAISVVRSESLPPTPSPDDPLPGDRDGSGNGNNHGSRDHGHAPPRRRGRKRRRPNHAAAPAGSADGMAMDTPAWACARRRRRPDGVAVDDGWTDARPCPPAPRQSRAVANADVRAIAPWPRSAGARRTRQRSKRGKRLWQRKDAGLAPVTAKAAAAKDDPPILDPRLGEDPRDAAGATPLAGHEPDGPPESTSPTCGGDREDDTAQAPPSRQAFPLVGIRRFHRPRLLHPARFLTPCRRRTARHLRSPCWSRWLFPLPPLWSPVRANLLGSRKNRGTCPRMRRNRSSRLTMTTVPWRPRAYPSWHASSHL